MGGGPIQAQAWDYRTHSGMATGESAHHIVKFLCVTYYVLSLVHNMMLVQALCCMCHEGDAGIELISIPVLRA